MENNELRAETRRAGRHGVRELREAGQVPAVIYGPGIESQPIAVDGKSLHRALAAAGAGLVSLQIGDSQPLQVLARAVQHHPVKHHVLHVDFLAVSMTDLLRLDVRVVLEGTAPALSQSGVVLIREMDSIEVECLPSDIPNRIVADVSRLATVDDSLYVRDLALPPGVKVLTDPDQVVVSLTMATAEPEEAAAEPVAADQVELVGKGKKEEAEEE